MRRRILALIIGMTVLVVLAFAIPLIFLIRNAVAQRADDTTRRVAQEISFRLVQSTYSDAQLHDLAADYAPRTVSISAPPGAGDPGDRDPGNGPGPQAGTSWARFTSPVTSPVRWRSRAPRPTPAPAWSSTPNT